MMWWVDGSRAVDVQSGGGLLCAVCWSCSFDILLVLVKDSK